MVSIYYHDTLSKIELSIRKRYVFHQHKKFVISFDLAAKFNDLLNVAKDRKTNQWPIEEELLDLVPMLNMGGVTRPDHIEQFLDIAFEEARTNDSVKERARRIGNRWRALALLLRKAHHGPLM